MAIGIYGECKIVRVTKRSVERKASFYEAFLFQVISPQKIFLRYLIKSVGSFLNFSINSKRTFEILNH